MEDLPPPPRTDLGSPRGLFLAVLAGLLLAAGCQDGQKAAGAAGPVAVQDSAQADRVPVPLELTLRALGTDHRQVIYRIDGARTLHFAGGAGAISSNPKPAGKLTEEQIKSIWALVHKGRLLEPQGRSAGLFESAEKKTWNVELTAGTRQARYTTIDGRIPELEELDKLLFEAQKKFRYAQVLQEIDEAREDPQLRKKK